MSDYDLIINGGTVVDPSEQVHGIMDVGIKDGMISEVAQRLNRDQAKRTIDATGLVVTPGLIDLHAHVAHDVTRISIDPVSNCLLKGCTTVVDAGSTGELTFAAFNKFIVQKNAVRILAFLNIESLGMIEGDTIEPPHPKDTDQRWADLLTAVDDLFIPLFINEENSSKLIHSDDTVVGIKWAHHGLRSLQFARQVADKVGCIIMAENIHMPETLRYLKKDDIVTHAYLYGSGPHGMNPPLDGLVDGAISEGKIHSEFFDAFKRGVRLDVGHGRGSFFWKVAKVAFENDVRPYTISTDLHKGSVNGPAFDLPTVMTKFLHLGMSLDEVVAATTTNPAKVLKRSGKIGTLEPGALADVAMFKLEEGTFPLVDCAGEVQHSAKRLTPVNVIVGGSPAR